MLVIPILGLLCYPVCMRKQDRNAPQSDSSSEHDQKGYFCYISSDGFEILVGRSASDNDYLTFRVAQQDDFWLHVAPTSGSHVVVRNPEGLKRLPKDTRKEAASMAAWYSKSRGGTKVAVHVTRARFVSKSRGSPAGTVSLKRYDIVRADARQRPALPQCDA